MKKLLLTTTLVIISCVVIGQETCLIKAWDTYNKRNWDLAVQNAEDCIFSFGPKANEIQKQLETNKYQLPKNYDVSKTLSSQQKEEIFSHGLLNDVATAYWICGMSYIRLNNKIKADKAFKNAEKLSFGLCYNPETALFWSPSKDANLRLKN